MSISGCLFREESGLNSCKEHGILLQNLLMTPICDFFGLKFVSYQITSVTTKFLLLYGTVFKVLEIYAAYNKRVPLMQLFLCSSHHNLRTRNTILCILLPYCFYITPNKYTRRTHGYACVPYITIAHNFYLIRHT